MDKAERKKGMGAHMLDEPEILSNSEFYPFNGE